MNKKRPWQYLAYRALWSALDALIPPSCAGCGKLGERWCADCQSKSTLISGLFCEVCGTPLAGTSAQCDSCYADRPHFDALRAWAVFEGPLRKALHSLKYARNRALGDELAARMLPFVESLGWQADLIIPIPLGKKRLKKRGYNQVAMVAKPLALALNIPYAPKGLARRKETRSQVGLSRAERRENIQDAFVAHINVRGKNVLVFDDVATTGSTLSASADALRKAGALRVYALTIARALPHHGLDAA